MNPVAGGHPIEISAEGLLGPLNPVEAKFAPAQLFLLGDVHLVQSAPRVSIIGSRKASPEGLRRAGKLARELAARGVTIVSGLAEGIDTAAHLAAIEQGGRTIGVLGTPLDQFFPIKNRELQMRIAQEHLLISQFAPGSSGGPRNFPMRNRTMALISHASVIVEAGESSGSLHQGWEALRLGRPLFLLKSVVENEALQWPKEMMKYGAAVLARTEDVLNVIPESLQEAHAEPAF